MAKPSPLHQAAEAGDLDKVQAQIARGADLSALDPRGMSALALAAEGGHAACVEALLAAGASARGDERAHHPLHVALSQDHTELFDRLIAANLPVDPWLSSWLLSELASLGDSARFAALLGRFGADEDTLAQAMADAAGADQVAMLKVLAATKVGGKKKPPLVGLHQAARSGAEAALSWLIEQGAPVDAPDADGDRPLHLAAQGDSVACVARLLKAGADASAKGSGGMTPLHWAASTPPLVEALLAAGASVAALDDEKQTPLHAAARFGSPAGVALLVKKGALIDAADREKNTPLHVAADRYKDTPTEAYAATLEALVAAGADLSAKNAARKTPADLLPTRAPKALRARLTPASGKASDEAKAPAGAKGEKGKKTGKGATRQYRVHLWEQVTTYTSRGVKTITLPADASIDEYLEENRESLEAELADMDIIKEKVIEQTSGVGADEVKH